MVKSLGEHLIWGYQGVEGPGANGDGGKEIEIHTTGWMLGGLKGEAWEEGECKARLGNRIDKGLAGFHLSFKSYDNWHMVAFLYPIIEISNFYIGDFEIRGCKAVIDMIRSILSMIHE